MALNPTAPSWDVPLQDPNGRVSQAWFGYLTQLSGAPGPIQTVSPSASPFTYAAPANGTLAVHGGTVSAITLTRARVANVPVGFVNGSVAVAANDQVTITYSVAPTINFIPT